MAVSLDDFDPYVVADHDITEEDLDRVVRYLRLLQGPDTLALEDIALGGYYGTSALLHEVVELDILLEREPGLLEMDRDAILAFWHANEDVHTRALAIEYRYLGDVIQCLFNVTVGIGALIVANASDWDLELLVESDVEIPLFKPDDEQVRRASDLLARLQAVNREGVIWRRDSDCWKSGSGTRGAGRSGGRYMRIATLSPGVRRCCSVPFPTMIAAQHAFSALAFVNFPLVSRRPNVS